MKFFLATLISILLHVFLGWEWSIVGGVVAGFWSLKSGWLSGAITVGLSWLLLVSYNLMVALDSTVEMFRVSGDLLGGLPGLFVPAFTIVVGCILGAVSGFLGKSIGGLKSEPVVVKID